MSDEYFGSGVQQGLQRRACALWSLLRNQPEYSCHGRAVAVTGQRPDTVQAQIAMARLQGAGLCDRVASDHLAARRAALTAAGLEIDEYTSWTGGEKAVQAARAVLADRPLRAGVDCKAVDADTPAEVLGQLDRVTQACGVLLPMGRFLRGLDRPSVFLYAQTSEGRVIGTAGAVAQFHPDGPDQQDYWWGMLATDEAFRGQSIALILGAEAIVRMADGLGLVLMHTGVRAGNAPSERLCAKLGLARSDRTDMIAIDKSVFAAGSMTK